MIKHIPGSNSRSDFFDLNFPPHNAKIFDIHHYGDKNNFPKVENYITGVHDSVDKSKLYSKIPYGGTNYLHINDAGPNVLTILGNNRENIENPYGIVQYHIPVNEILDNPYNTGLKHGHKLLAARHLANHYDTTLGIPWKFKEYTNLDRENPQRLPTELHEEDKLIPHVLSDKYKDENILPLDFHPYTEKERSYSPEKARQSHLEKLIDVYSDVYGNLAKDAHSLPNLDRRSFINYMTDNIRRKINTDHTTKQVLMGILRGIHSGHV